MAWVLFRGGAAGRLQLALTAKWRRRDSAGREPPRGDQECGVAAHVVLWAHRKTDDVPVALQGLPRARFGPALLFP